MLCAAFFALSAPHSEIARKVDVDIAIEEKPITPIIMGDVVPRTPFFSLSRISTQPIGSAPSRATPTVSG
jgi:hypothetical protein